MSFKISVIVPVYNVEKYLDRCLSSLVSQTLEDIEIIVVNDGSPDNSQSIIDGYAEIHPDKIVALKQENKGLGPARNLGIAHAKGAYIGFVDSDDWVAPDMFELLYKTAMSENSDIVMCDFTMVNEADGQCIAVDIMGADKGKHKPVADFMLHSTNPAMACNKLFKRSLFQTAVFPDYYYEDLATIPIILSNCEKTSFISKPLYYYLKRADSITAQRNNSKNLDVMTAWERCFSECNPRYEKEIAYAIYFSLCAFLDIKREHLAEFFDFFRRNENRFLHNEYIDEAVRHGRLADLARYAKIY